MKRLASVIVASALLVSSAFSVNVTWKTTTAKGGHWNAKVTRPVFPGATPIERFVNRALDDAAAASMKSFTTDMAEMGTPAFAVTAPWEYDDRFEVVYADANLISIRQLTYSYTGGAHPNTVMAGHTFAMVGGSPMKLSFRNLIDMKVEQDRFLGFALLNAVNEAKTRRGSDPLMELSREDCEQFVITPNGVTFLFSRYVLGSYAEGDYEVRIGWDTWQDYRLAGTLRGIIARYQR